MVREEVRVWCCCCWWTPALLLQLRVSPPEDWVKLEDVIVAVVVVVDDGDVAFDEVEIEAEVVMVVVTPFSRFRGSGGD